MLKIDLKQSTIIAVSTFLSTFLSSISCWSAQTITAIDFLSGSSGSTIRITADGPITSQKTDNAEDKQVVLEIQGAKLTQQTQRPLDTSSFPGSVSLVSPYQVAGQSGVARVVVQLRTATTTELLQSGNVVSLNIDGGAGATTTPSASSGDSAKALASASSGASVAAPAQSQSVSGDASTSNGTASDPNAPDPAGAGVSPPEKIIESVITANGTKRYVGKSISLQVRDMDLVDVFQLIGEASGFNVVVGPEIKGKKITLSLSEVPWDQALDLILTTQGLGAERRNNILRITTLDALTQEKQKELQAKKAAEANSPKVTRIFPISYAKLDDIVTAFKNFGSNLQASDAQTLVQKDERTNSIIVRDTADNIERMKKLIELLDYQTPQILIEAKIIEASENFSNQIGVSLGLSKVGSNNDLGVSAGGGLTTGVTPYVPGTASGGATLASAVAGPPAVSLFSIGSSTDASSLNIPGLAKINAALTLGESESDVKVLASPKLVVLNKESASITSGTPVNVPISATSSTGSVVATSQVVTANLSLNVTPTVTNDSGVLMDVGVSRDTIVIGTGVGPRNIKTKVLVDSGSTLVIGGIYVDSVNNSSSGIPFLRKLPLVGWLFGQETKTTAKNEIFIFLTPKILNEKESGLAPTPPSG